jgi:threonine aldolase
VIDLRSDVCSAPTDAMWEAMKDAELGWALVGEDASVNLLCERVATLLGKAAAIWVPTCGMGNLAAMLTFCSPGDRVVLEAASHALSSGSTGITDIARLEPRPIWAEDGRLDPEHVEHLIAEEQAALLILENTHARAGGTTLSVELTEELAAAAKRQYCRIHIDGTRLINASVALGVPLAALAAPANSVVLSLNRGLSAPFGAVLAGSEEVVGRVRLMLHKLGGSTIHLAGISAAAGLVALDTMVGRIADDHRRARDLAVMISAIPGVTVRPETVETNILFADVAGTGIAAEDLVSLLQLEGVRVLERDSTRIRLVTHRLIGDEEVTRAAAILADVVERHAVPLLVLPEVPDEWDWENEVDDADADEGR